MKDFEACERNTKGRQCNRPTVVNSINWELSLALKLHPEVVISPTGPKIYHTNTKTLVKTA
jgi:hypothetical protein